MKSGNKLFFCSLPLLGFMLLLTISCEKKDTEGENQEDPSDSITIPNNNDDDTIVSVADGWSKLGDINANNMIWSLTVDASGNVYAAGNFTNANGYHYVAKWNGTAWSELGNLNANNSIFALTTDAGDNIYAVGSFTNGVTADGGTSYVAKWDGDNWYDIGGGGGTILTSDAVGNIYKGTSKWDGSSWSTICASCSLGYSNVKALVSNAAGTIQYAGGDFHFDNGYRYVASCDGSNCWSELGSLNANNNIQALATDISGNVYAAGAFTNGTLPTNGHYYVAKWNGTTWSELGSLNANSDIYFLAIDNTTGNLYASGYFTDPLEGAYVAKWDGITWSSLGSMGLSPTPITVDASGTLYSVVASTNGKIFCVVVHE